MKVLLIDVYNYNKGGAETVCFNTGDMLEQKWTRSDIFYAEVEAESPF